MLIYSGIFYATLSDYEDLVVELTSGSLASMLEVKRCRQSECSGSTVQTSGPADNRKTVRAVSRLA